MSLFALYNKISSTAPNLSKMGLQLQGFNRPHYFAVWPESIDDRRSVNYVERNVVGSSHPIYQWTHGGSRDLSFEILVYQDFIGPSSDTKENPPLAADQTHLEKILATAKNPLFSPYFAKSTSELSASEELQSKNVPSATDTGREPKYNLANMSVIQTVEFLRSLTYPEQTPSGLIKAPPPLYVGIWNSEDVRVLFVECVLRSVDVKFEAFFRNGVPRIATVNMSFSEITQNSKNWVVTNTEMNRMYGRDAYKNTKRTKGFDIKG